MVEDGENILLLPLLEAVAALLLLLLERVVREYEVLLLLQVGVDAVVNDERQGTHRLLLHDGQPGGGRTPWSNAVEGEVISVPVVQLCVTSFLQFLLS